MKARDVERTAGLAVLAADALVRVHVHDSVGVLDDRAGRRARREAAGLLAVHALVLAHQPDETAVEVPLVEPDQVPVFRVQGRQRLVGAGLLGRDMAQVVPLDTRRLAGFAPDTSRRVDVFRNGRHRPHARLASPHGGGGASDLEILLNAHPLLLTLSRCGREKP